MKQTQNNTT